MSTFACEAVRVKIKEHPNADAIEIAQVGLYECIVKKGYVKDGDLAIYIPEGAIVPDNVIKASQAWDEVKDCGRLAGAGKNRVKAVKLRGVLSQGLLFSPWYGTEFTDLVSLNLNEGQDYAEHFGITKYQPTIPQTQAFKAAGALYGMTPRFDVENFKKYPDVIKPGELVTVTEKIHGISCLIGHLDSELVDGNIDPSKLYDGNGYITTKNQSKHGIVINPNIDTSIYTKTILGKYPKIFPWLKLLCKLHRFKSLVLVGEIFGKGVQDLEYGGCEPDFRAFEMYYSDDGYTYTECHWLTLKHYCMIMKVPMVPILWEGLYKEELLDLNKGKSIIAPGQIREGIVVRSQDGTKRLKYVSEAYLLRKGEQTEYE